MGGHCDSWLVVLVRGHSITTWTRWEGVKKSFFSMLKVKKNVHEGGEVGGIKKMVKLCQISCWMTPNENLKLITCHLLFDVGIFMFWIEGKGGYRLFMSEVLNFIESMLPRMIFWASTRISPDLPLDPIMSSFSTSNSFCTM